MHRTTTNHSWAAFMNGNHLQKVRMDPALSVGNIFVCFFNPVAFRLMLEELVILTRVAIEEEV